MVNDLRKEEQGIDVFICDDAYPKTLKEQIKRYIEISKKIEELKAKKVKYDELLNLDNIYVYVEGELTFKEKYVIYKMLKNAVMRDSNPQNYKAYNGIDLSLLQMKFGNMFDDLYEYITIVDSIKDLESQRHDIIFKDINIQSFDKGHYSCHCVEGHTFIIEDDALKCVYCGASTKGFNLSQKEFEFLIFVAKQRGFLLENFTKEDWSIIQSIIKEQDERRKQREELDMDADDYWDKVEEQYYEDFYEAAELKDALNKAYKKK